MIALLSLIALAYGIAIGLLLMMNSEDPHDRSR